MKRVAAHKRECARAESEELEGRIFLAIPNVQPISSLDSTSDSRLRNYGNVFDVLRELGHHGKHYATEILSANLWCFNYDRVNSAELSVGLAY